MGRTFTSLSSPTFLTSRAAALAAPTAVVVTPLVDPKVLVLLTPAVPIVLAVVAELILEGGPIVPDFLTAEGRGRVVEMGVGVGRVRVEVEEEAEERGRGARVVETVAADTAARRAGDATAMVLDAEAEAARARRAAPVGAGAGAVVGGTPVPRTRVVGTTDATVVVRVVPFVTAGEPGVGLEARDVLSGAL